MNREKTRFIDVSKLPDFNWIVIFIYCAECIKRVQVVKKCWHLWLFVFSDIFVSVGFSVSRMIIMLWVNVSEVTGGEEKQIHEFVITFSNIVKVACLHVCSGFNRYRKIPLLKGHSGADWPIFFSFNKKFNISHFHLQSLDTQFLP